MGVGQAPAERIQKGSDSVELPGGIRSSTASTANNRASDCVRAGRPGVIQDVCEQTIIENTEAPADHSLVMTKEAWCQMRRVSKPYARTKIVSVARLRARVDAGEA